MCALEKKREFLGDGYKKDVYSWEVVVKDSTKFCSHHQSFFPQTINADISSPYTGEGEKKLENIISWTSSDFIY